MCGPGTVLGSDTHLHLSGYLRESSSKDSGSLKDTNRTGELITLAIQQRTDGDSVKLSRDCKIMLS